MSVNLFGINIPVECGLCKNNRIGDRVGIRAEDFQRDARLREWFKRLKRRRGASIARVAGMRKLATIIWYMLSKRRSYAQCRALAEAGSNEMEQPHCAEEGR